ncbi:MAG: DNA-directed RNA polymerase subunit beta' [Candidatus Sericytochromatia bacterium]|nr:DNA-directed RNA polymerase subunit beta' [Candidatus Sericytochromatia bacterium]
MTQHFDYIKVGIASPDRIRSWSRGAVTKPETINYRTLKPERDGLFCERIFGPAKDWECHCGKYKRVRHKGIICERCGVEVTDSKVRRYRMGHIDLAAPVAHIWYLKGIPSYLSQILDIPLRQLEDVVYFNSYIVIDPGTTNLQRMDIISEDDYETLMADENCTLEAGMGAEAMKILLAELNLPELGEKLRLEIVSSSGQKRAKAIKRLRVVDAFIQSSTDPSWMVLDVIPVIPPDLRPMVQLDGGRFATSDLNDLYRRVINRNNRLYRLREMHAPDIIIRNEMRMLQEAVDALIDNGRRGRAVVGPNNRALKSLSDIIEGKQGRFRQNLLGKRVDYSGRSVIVVGPYLKLHQCGLPKEMALELFKPFVMNKLVERGIVQNIKSAKKKIERGETIVWDILEDVIKGHPVLLNRAPTLHRLGIQAFEPVLVEGRAIQLHPLVCTAFNADFDGDQMAVHVPLSVEAQTEARLLMMSTNNVLAPATGRPIITPTQDMVLGCYYLTTVDASKKKGEGLVFGTLTDAVGAYQTGHLDLHASIKVRIKHDRLQTSTEEVADLEHGGKGQVIETTVGRIIFNESLPAGFPFINTIVNKKVLENVVMRAFEEYSPADAALLADQLKNLGFKYATRAGVTVAIHDLTTPDEKRTILAQAEQEIERSRRAYLRGSITEVERHNKAIDTWAEATEDVTKLIVDKFDRLNSVYMMAFSGARGNLSQVRQLVGMRGLMADPSGRIIDLPIKANFREGLNVTEYIISSYGARKGLVDTALRTADSGYLTRRLADVAQDVIIREEDCGTNRGVALTSIKDGDSVVVSLGERLKGRVLADDVLDPATGDILVPANTVLTQLLSSMIVGADVPAVKIRSPLTCQSRNGVCRECYGWSLTNNQKVDIGEAVGIIAAQSIGEPGTQLTMRTFHTGGVFTKNSSTAVVKADHNGQMVVGDLSAREHRTRHGDVVMVTEREHVLSLKTAKKAYSVVVPAGYRVLVAEGQEVHKGDLIAESVVESGRTSRKSLEKAYKDISADIAGTVEFVGFRPSERRDRQGNVTKTADRAGEVWVLAGDTYTLPAGYHAAIKPGQRVKQGEVLTEYRMVTEHGGKLRLGADIRTEVLDGRTVITAGRDIAIVTANMVLPGTEVTAGKKDLFLKATDGTQYTLRVVDGQRVEGDAVVLADHVDEKFTVSGTGEVRFVEGSLSERSDRRLVTKKGEILFVPEEMITINKPDSALGFGLKSGMFVEPGTSLIDGHDYYTKTAGILELFIDNDMVKEAYVYPGTRVDVPDGLELHVKEDDLVAKGAVIAQGFTAPHEGLVKVIEGPEGERIVIVRLIERFHVLPADSTLNFKSTTDELGLKSLTRLAVKNGERVKAGTPLIRTELVLTKGPGLGNLAGRIEITPKGEPKEGEEQTFDFAIVILENMALRRDLPSVGRFGEHKEEFIVTTLEAKDGATIKPKTTVVKTEILSHTDGIVQFPSSYDAGDGREVRRLVLITPEHEVLVPFKGKLALEDGAMVREGDPLADGLAAPDGGKIRLHDKGHVAIRHGRPYLISSGTQLMVDQGDMVQRGENLATLVYDRVKTGDIIQGLPRVEELLEGRKPKESAVIAEHDGTVKLLIDFDENVRVFIETEVGTEEYAVPPGGRLIVSDGEAIAKGDPLTDGPINPHDVLRVQGVERLQRFLVDEVQMVYRSQGVEIADKHIEVIVRQMTRKMKVDDPGDTTLLPGEMVDVLELDREQRMITDKEGRPAVTTPILLGITKASLNTESFISAASFQETTRVLTEAAIEGKKDWLHGLKENVVIGRLIPAGTGLFNQQDDEPVAPDYLLPSSASELIGAPVGVGARLAEESAAGMSSEDLSPGEAIMPEDGDEDELGDESAPDEEI